jgi:hypothetical protein
MRLSQRLITAAVLIAFSSALAGCGSMAGWDPSDLLDFLDTKKKLPGDRKPVFPEGVPGLQQGVPKELYKGNVEQQQQQDAAAAAAAAATPAPEPKAKARPKGRVNVGAVRSAPAPEAAPEPDAAPTEDTSGAPPAPKGKIKRRRTTAPPADDATAPAAAPAQQAAPATSAFPAPVPSGTFSR